MLYDGMLGRLRSEVRRLGICGTTRSADSLGVSVGLVGGVCDELFEDELYWRELTESLRSSCALLETRAEYVLPKSKVEGMAGKLILQISEPIIEGEIGMNGISQAKNWKVGQHLSRRLGGDRDISRGGGVSCC